MDRRDFLAAGGTLSIASLAGCSDDSGVQDSDGDGVIDSQDYAPKDPDVQEKADLQATVGKTATATSTASATETPTRTPSPTPNPTETPTARATEAANSIKVQSEHTPEGISHFVEYGLKEATVSLNFDGPRVSEVSYEELWIVAADLDYNIYATGSTSIAGGSGTDERYTTELDWESKPIGTPLFYSVLLAPAGTTYEELSGTNTRFLIETDPFELKDKRTVAKTLVPELLDMGAESGDGYERSIIEGEFELNFEGTTNGQAWNVSFTIFKSGYVNSRRRDHGRSRSEYVAYETSNGFSSSMATILSEEAERNGFTGKRMKAEFVIDFIQHLPYVPDDVSTGFDDYTKFGNELFAEMGGDCEDTAISLAGILQSEPFEYDMVLIQPPGHMAAGIYGKDDLPGVYWEYDGRKYYYIETTGVGWGIGDLPQAYEDSKAYVHQV